MAKTLKDIHNQMKKLVEDVNSDKKYLYVVTCHEELTQYTGVIGYYDSIEDAQHAVAEDARENNNREDALDYYIDKYVYEDTVPAWKAEESIVTEE